MQHLMIATRFSKCTLISICPDTRTRMKTARLQVLRYRTWLLLRKIRRLSLRSAVTGIKMTMRSRNATILFIILMYPVLVSMLSGLFIWLVLSLSPAHQSSGSSLMQEPSPTSPEDSKPKDYESKETTLQSPPRSFVM